MKSFILTGMVLLASAAYCFETSEEALKAGKEAAGKNNTAKALVCFEEAEKLPGKDSSKEEAIRLSAGIFLKNKEREKALAKQRMVQQIPNASPHIKALGFYCEGNMQRDIGNYKEAMIAYQKALDQKAGTWIDGNTMENLANLLVTSNPDGAVALYLRVIEQSKYPDQKMRGYFGLGRSYQQKKMYGEAIAAYKTVVGSNQVKEWYRIESEKRIKQIESEKKKSITTP